ncbi:MAG TPA: nuclear transport factor 2 family protein [Pyrinomonadaceae bacterium]|nr:nuclear transport factor 2 family protein [Pyrinomonadaceae bacterium]
MCCKTFIAVAFLLVTIGATPPQKRNDVESVRATDQKLDVALSSSDDVALDQILAVGYVEINAQGELSDKGQLLAFARARKAGPAGVVVGPDRQVVQQRLHTNGDVAILIHKITTRYPHMDYQTVGKPPAQGPELIDEETRMRVYSRNGSAWQLVAQQTTAIPKTLGSSGPEKK